MDQLIELLKQIQELAGAGIDALKGAMEGGEKPEGGKPEGKPEGDMPPGGDGPPPEEPPAGQ